MVDTSNDPRTLADTRPLEAEAESEKNEGDGGGQKGHGEGRCHELPCDRGNNGGDESTEQSGLEEFLSQIRNSENVLVSLVELDGGDTGNDEEAQSDAHLSTNLVVLMRKTQMMEMKNLKNLQHKSGIYQLWTNQISEMAKKMKRIPNRNWKVFQILVVKTFKVNKMAKTILKKKSKRSPSKRKRKKLKLK